MVNKSLHLWDRTSVLLILVCIWLPAALLQSSGWAADLDQVEFLAVIGVILGLVIGRSMFSTAISHIIFVIFSSIIPLWLFTVRMTPDGAWLPRLTVILQRAYLALFQAISGHLVQDPLIFIMFCSYFFWITGYFTGYGFSRRWNPWQGLLSAAGIFGVIDFYTGSSTAALWGGGILIVCLIWLAARMYWIGQKNAWQKEGALIEKDAGDSVLRLASIVAIVLVLLSWNLETIIRSFTPGTPENERVSEYWKNIQSGLQNNFVSLKSSTSLTGSYSAGMKLGNQAPLQQKPAFQVKILNSPASGARYYWRVRVYEEYKDGRWQIQKTQNFSSKALDADELANLAGYSRVRAQYIWQEADGTIIPFAGRFGGLDIPFHLESTDPATLVSGDGLLYPNRALTPDALFILESAIFTGSQDVLRNIPYTIPPQIFAKYLQIPSSMPGRVIDLGRQIAVGDTVFDRIQAVNTFLRSGYEYKSQISPVPSGKDPVDWFLFESKQGFCNYYASAEVLLLRAAGIPARLAVGYSQGEPTEFGYQVKMSNGHAWPEVYFPQVGWIPFEPTAIQPDMPYSTASSDNQTDDTNDLTPEERRGNMETISEPPASPEDTAAAAQKIISNRMIALIVVIVAIVCGIGLWFVYFRKRWKKLPRLSLLILNWLAAHKIPIPDWLAWWNWYTGLSDLALQYYWIEKLALHSGLTPTAPATPAELLALLARRMPQLKTAASLFRFGLYRELYSREKEYDRVECKTAGAVVQKELRSYFFRRFLRLAPN